MKYLFGLSLFLLLFACQQETQISTFSRQHSCIGWPGPKLKKVVRPGNYYLESLLTSIDSVNRIIADKIPKTIEYPLSKTTQKVWYNNGCFLGTNTHSSDPYHTFEYSFYVFDEYHWCNEIIHYYETYPDSIKTHQFYYFRKSQFLFALSEVMTAPKGQFYARLTNNKFLQSKARNVHGRFLTELKLYGI